MPATFLHRRHAPSRPQAAYVGLQAQTADALLVPPEVVGELVA
jgi:hypothetical protein